MCVSRYNMVQCDLSIFPSERRNHQTAVNGVKPFSKMKTVHASTRDLFRIKYYYSTSFRNNYIIFTIFKPQLLNM